MISAQIAKDRDK